MTFEIQDGAFCQREGLTWKEIWALWQPGLSMQPCSPGANKQKVPAVIPQGNAASAGESQPTPEQSAQNTQNPEALILKTPNFCLWT